VDLGYLDVGGHGYLRGKREHRCGLGFVGIVVIVVVVWVVVLIL
jgi:hypothetical protein